MTLAQSTSVVALVGLTCAHVARAEARDPVAAEALFQQAKELLVVGDWDAACQKLESSFEKDPSAGTQFNIARCREHEARYADAWLAYHDALRLNVYTVSESRRAKLERLAEKAIFQLEPRLSRIKIVLTDPPPEVEVRRDGELIPGPAWADAFLANPGRHEVITMAPGYRAERTEVILNEGEMRVLNIALVAEPARAVIEVAAPPPTPIVDMEQRRAPTPHDEGKSLPTAWGLGLAGGLSLGAAGYFGVRTLMAVHDSSSYCNQANECTQPGYDLRRQARLDQTVGLVLLGAGLASLGAGVYLGLSARSSEPRMAVMARPNAAILTVGGPW